MKSAAGRAAKPASTMPSRESPTRSAVMTPKYSAPLRYSMGHARRQDRHRPRRGQQALDCLGHRPGAGRGRHAARVHVPGRAVEGERRGAGGDAAGLHALLDRKSTRLNSSHANISYAVFCLKKKKKKIKYTTKT